MHMSGKRQVSRFAWMCRQSRRVNFAVLKPLVSGCCSPATQPTQQHSVHLFAFPSQEYLCSCDMLKVQLCNTLPGTTTSLRSSPHIVQASHEPRLPEHLYQGSFLWTTRLIKVLNFLTQNSKISA